MNLKSSSIRCFYLLLAVLTILSVLPACGVFAPKPLQTTEEVKVVRNLAYDGGDGRDGAHLLDLFLPQKRNHSPTIVLIHGGAWILGSKEYMGGLGFELARNGYAVANVNYRLTPRVKHPGHIEDVAKAISWVQKNIGKYGGDPGTIILMGHSAGGHLASLAALNEKYLKKYSIDPSKDIAGVVAISGVYKIDDHFLDGVFTDSKKAWEDASPIEHISKDSPPFLILIAENEMRGKIPLVEQAEDFYQALQQAGVDSKIREIPGVNHDTIIRSVATHSSKTLPTILEFFKSQHLAPTLPARIN